MLATSLFAAAAALSAHHHHPAQGSQPGTNTWTQQQCTVNENTKSVVQHIRADIERGSSDVVRSLRATNTCLGQKGKSYPSIDPNASRCSTY